VPHRTTVRNTIIRDFSRSPRARGYGVLAAHGSGHRIYNNLIYNLEGTGGGAGVYVMHASDVDVSHNTVYGNARHGIAIEPNAMRTTLRNNLVFGNRAGDLLNRGSATVEESNLLGVDPQFVDPSGGNFRLRPGSPALDRGTPVQWITTDLAGTRRPLGGAPDIGAFEGTTDGRPTPEVPRGLFIVR
jgi:parallel beta-helix repeat protein